MNILAIESSCDETAAAVIQDGIEILSSVIATSSAMHEKWGGIVPEVAAREQLASILPVITEALLCFHTSSNIKETIEKHIDAIAVTIGPGLIGSLLIGIETAKTLSFSTGKPIIPVNHVLAHMYANFLKTENGKQKTENQIPSSVLRPLSFPAISLVVSGGHTELFLMNNVKELRWLGGTIDDASGEAFDKTARLLGFGHGGGKAIQEAAGKYISEVSEVSKVSEVSEAKLPRPMMHDGTLNFSFSGLKTAIQREWKKIPNPSEKQRNAFAYEVEETITDVLVKKTLKAAQMYDAKSILISGGVASNQRLRKKFIFSMNNACPERLPCKESVRELSTITFHSPPIELCTDNAAMIGSYAFFRGTPVDWHNLQATPDLSVEVSI